MKKLQNRIMIAIMLFGLNTLIFCMGKEPTDRLKKPKVEQKQCKHGEQQQNH